MSERTDVAMMVSSDLIAEVMGRYFNEEMFKRSVKIVDLKSAEDGYVFSLAFEERVAAPFDYTVQTNNIPGRAHANIYTDSGKRSSTKKVKE